MKGIMDVIMWIIIAALVVLVIMNPTGFTQDVGALGTGATGIATVLSGSGYQKPK